MSAKAENGWIVCIQWGVSNYTYWEDYRCGGLEHATSHIRRCVLYSVGV